MWNRDEKLTLVCAKDPEPWMELSATRAIITIPNTALLIAAVHHGFHDSGKDIQHVVFDRSIDPAAFLSVLAQLPHGFRGDVLFISEEGPAFLSAVSPRGDGRELFSLREEDVDFYVAEMCAESDLRRVEAVPGSSTVLLCASAGLR